MFVKYCNRLIETLQKETFLRLIKCNIKIQLKIRDIYNNAKSTTN